MQAMDLCASQEWKNADADIDVFNNLKRKSEMFKYKFSHLYIFTKKFITSKLYDEYVIGHVKIYPLDEIIKSGCSNFAINSSN